MIHPRVVIDQLKVGWPIVVVLRLLLTYYIVSRWVWVTGGVLTWLKQVMLEMMVLALWLGGLLLDIRLHLLVLLRVVLKAWFSRGMNRLLYRILLISKLSLLTLRLRMLPREWAFILNGREVRKIPLLIGSVWECQASNRLLLAADVWDTVFLGNIKQRLILIGVILLQPFVALIVDLKVLLLVSCIIKRKSRRCVLIQLQLVLVAQSATLLMWVQSGIQAVLPLLRVLILFFINYDGWDLFLLPLALSELKHGVDCHLKPNSFLNPC